MNVWGMPLVQNERGGGSKAQPAQVIPPPAPPNVGQNAADLYAAQAQYNPQLQEQAIQSQISGAPRLAQSQYDVAAQYTPLYRALLEQQFPQLTTFANQTGQELSSPTGLTPEQQAAQSAIRQRAYDESARGIRSAANVGGTLYGGNSQLREDRARNELSQGFATQDIQLQQQQRAQAVQNLISLLQVAGINVQQPSVPQFGQSVVPGSDNLYNALVSNNSNFGVQPATAGSPGFFGSFVNGYRGI